MTQIVGDATHLKGKALSGNPDSGQSWVYDGTQYVTETIVSREAYRFINVDSETIGADDPTDTLHLSGVSGIKFDAASGIGSGTDSIVVLVSGLQGDQIPNWSEISGMAHYASGVVDDVSGLSGFVMASGNGFAVTAPAPVSGRVLKASGVNPLTDLYWAVDQTGSGGEGSGNAYAYIFVQGTTTLDANAVDDTLNISGRSGISVTGSSGSGQGQDVIFFEVSGLSTDQIPQWLEISGLASGGSGIAVGGLGVAAGASGMAVYSSGKLDDTDSTSGFVLASGNGLVVLEGPSASGQILKWSGTNILTDAYFTEDGAGATAPDVEQLQNSLIMLAWDVDSDDNTYSDVATDAFEDETGIDAAASSGEVFNSSGHYYTYTPAAEDQSTELDPAAAVTDESDAATYVIRKDVKGSIGYWQQNATRPHTGYFSSDQAGSTPVSITAVGTEDEVIEGCLVVFSGGTATICHIDNDGDVDGEVVLDDIVADQTAITAIYGIAVDTANDEIVINQGIDADGSINTGTTACTATMTSNSTPSPNATSATTAWTSYGRYAWKAFNGTCSGIDDCWHASAVAPQSLEYDFGSGNEKVVNRYNIQCRDSEPAPSWPTAWTLYGQRDGSSTWVELDSRSSITSPGQGNWYGSYFDFKNAVPFRKYRITITTCDDGTPAIGQLKLVEATDLQTPGTQYLAYTTNSSRIDCSNWIDLGDTTPVQVAETLNGSSEILHAVSFDDRATWQVWTGSMWQTIVQQGGDTKWEFWNGSAFVDADVSGSDTMMSALEQAFADGDNDWSSVTINTMTKANWTDTGGWSTSVDSIDWAVALTADGDDLPEFDKVTFTYDQAPVCLSLVTTSWEAGETDPDHAYCVLMIEPNEAFTINTDLRAYVSMDDGVNYEQINFDASPFREIGDKDFYRGDQSGLTPRADSTIRLKVECDKDIEIHAIALGVKYS